MELTDTQREQLEVFTRRVESSPHNLVSRRARDELRDRHVPECVALAASLPAGPRLLDVGSGGGFPGVVIAITRPDLEVTLLDATAKKVQFLQETRETTGVPFHVEHGRAEDLRDTHANTFDLCTARAVAPLGRLLGWTVPFLRPGGLLYAVKGDRWRDELDEARTELRVWGAEVVATPDEIHTPDDTTSPMVVIIRRTPTA